MQFFQGAGTRKRWVWSGLQAESCGLEWQMRYAIIRGVCCGLHYLHAECRIVHLDLKPQNILLDDNMLPKLADFGISRLFDQQQSRIITEHRAGTFGYMAPEYIANGLITTKSDMFSLGVIIIELMTGRREYPQSSEMPYEDFVKNVIGNWRNRLKRTLGYKALEICSQQIERCIVLALKCVNPDPKDIIQLMNEPESTSSIFDQNEEPRVWQESEVLIFSGSKDLSYYSSSAIEFNNIMGSQGRILTLEALPEDKAWDLFCKKSFPTEINNECPNDLKPLSKEIFSKCQGLPLAILLVGSLLHEHEKTVEEWRSINDQLSWEMINNSRLDHIRNVLQLSFIYLPTYLKSCFLYCSLFPGDHLFQRKTLVRLWMAEGFIIEKGESTLEQVAEGYLKELVNRNMLQLVGRNTFGRMKTFRMHDTVGELAVDLCKEPNFGVKYEEDKCGGFLQMDGQRVVVHKLKKDIQQSFSSIHGLWTFIALDKNMPSFTLLPHLSKKSRYMKMLELSGLPIEKVPDAIGDLFNLRHLGLRDTKVKLLPKSIEKLSNLLTLDLCRSEIREVPAGIVKLNNLRHLFAEKVNDLSGTVIHTSSGVCITKGLGNLTNLQTLQALEAQDESVRQLGELKQLRSLRILNVKGIYSERLCESLVQMPFLSYLDVRASDENEVLMLSALPHNLQKRRLNGRLSEGTLLGESPLLQAAEQNLHDLRLRWSQLREDPLPSLSRLANLTVLVFTRAYNGEKLEFLTGWFPRLKILYMKDMPNLKQLEIKKGAMTTLEELELSNLSGMAGGPMWH
uniref:Uncharacterized protein n=1 Tax=Avena sativa TaxID=4498 RepID=A0ACD5UG95_AVESA